MEFREILRNARENDKKAMLQIIEMYLRCILKFPLEKYKQEYLDNSYNDAY